MKLGMAMACQLFTSVITYLTGRQEPLSIRRASRPRPVAWKKNIQTSGVRVESVAKSVTFTCS